MDPIYAGDVGTVISVDCGVDVTSAASISMAVLTPLGNAVVWPATLVDGSTSIIQYTTVENDLVEPGTYMIQSLVSLGLWSGRGKTAKLIVLPKFS